MRSTTNGDLAFDALIKEYLEVINGIDLPKKKLARLAAHNYAMTLSLAAVIESKSFPSAEQDPYIASRLTEATDLIRKNRYRGAKQALAGLPRRVKELHGRDAAVARSTAAKTAGRNRWALQHADFERYCRDRWEEIHVNLDQYNQIPRIDHAKIFLSNYPGNKKSLPSPRTTHDWLKKWEEGGGLQYSD